MGNLPAFITIDGHNYDLVDLRFHLEDGELKDGIPADDITCEIGLQLIRRVEHLESQLLMAAARYEEATRSTR